MKTNIFRRSKCLRFLLKPAHVHVKIVSIDNNDVSKTDPLGIASLKFTRENDNSKDLNNRKIQLRKQVCIFRILKNIIYRLSLSKLDFTISCYFGIIARFV